MRLDVGFEPVDLGLEVFELDHQATPLELDQRQLGLGVEEVLGGLVGAFAGGGDLARGPLGGVVVGLGGDARPPSAGASTALRPRQTVSTLGAYRDSCYWPLQFGYGHFQPSNGPVHNRR